MKNTLNTNNGLNQLSKLFAKVRDENLINDKNIEQWIKLERIVNETLPKLYTTLNMIEYNLEDCAIDFFNDIHKSSTAEPTGLHKAVKKIDVIHNKSAQDSLIKLTNLLIDNNNINVFRNYELISSVLHMQVQYLSGINKNIFNGIIQDKKCASDAHIIWNDLVQDINHKLTHCNESLNRM